MWASAFANNVPIYGFQNTDSIHSKGLKMVSYGMGVSKAISAVHFTVAS